MTQTDKAAFYMSALIEAANTALNNFKTDHAGEIEALNEAAAGTVAPNACTAGAAATQLGARKLADLVGRGHDVIGHILHKDGQYALLDGSCRWLSKPQYQRLMHEQDGSLFGATTACHTAKLRAAIADARHVFEGQKVAEDVLHYIEQVLAAGAPAPAETGIVPGAENASIAKEAQTPLGSAPTVVAGSEWPAWARDLDKLAGDVKQIEAATGNLFSELANILGTVGADTFDQAAAAMAAESAKKVADAERSVAARATVSNDATPAIVSRMVVEVDTTQLDAALAKAEQLKVVLAGLLPATDLKFQSLVLANLRRSTEGSSAIRASPQPYR